MLVLSSFNQLFEEEKDPILPIKTSEEFPERLHKFSQFSKNKRKWVGLCNSIKKRSDKLNLDFGVVSVAR